MEDLDDRHPLSTGVIAGGFLEGGRPFPTWEASTLASPGGENHPGHAYLVGAERASTVSCLPHQPVMFGPDSAFDTALDFCRSVLHDFGARGTCIRSRLACGRILHLSSSPFLICCTGDAGNWAPLPRLHYVRTVALSALALPRGHAAGRREQSSH